MFKIINLHLRYFFTKNNVIVFLLLFCAYILIGLFESMFYINPSEQILFKETYQSQYDYLMITVFKLIIIVFSTYIFSLIKSNSYFMLLSISKLKYHFSKVISNILVITMLTLFMIIIYLCCACFTKWFALDINIIKTYFIIMAEGVIFGLITNIFCYILKTNFAFIFVFFLFIVCENTFDDSLFCQVLNVFIPVNLTNNGCFIYIPLMIILYFFTSFYLYDKHEIY